MRLKPLPVVMISTLTAKGSADAIRALELGAVEIIGKPSQKVADIAEYSDSIADAIRAAALSQKKVPLPKVALKTFETPLQNPLPEAKPPADKRPPLIVVGASTGGTEALKELLTPLPPTLPPILIVQHMPEGFTEAFAKRLNSCTAITVEEGKHRKPAKPGHAYIAPGGKHMEVKFLAGDYYMQLTDVPPVSRHRPSVNVLFHSAVNAAGKNLSAAILTGMGDDGAAGLGQIKAAGGYTLTQDAASSVVYGMPKKAFEAGYAAAEGTPQKIAKIITERYKP
jgi:two-component system chemotaxis response regulator CheB